MPRWPGFMKSSPAVKIFLGVLACAYLVYMVAFVRTLNPSLFTPSQTIVDHQEDTSANIVGQYWTVTSMQNATNVDQQDNNTADFTQESNSITKGKAAQQAGVSPLNSDVSYPLSTVGKVFFTGASGQDMVCSGTAVVSLNRSVVDTAGHCLYWAGDWVHNVIFCPLYDNGTTPYGCWVARDLEAPSGWINAKPNDLHEDFGSAIVNPNSYGLLTDVVGGSGWAYNQATNQSFSAYGYPAGHPFDGQTIQNCESSSSTSWPHGGGTVISIPCNMTGGSSGGPWFIKINGNWYLNGHNDFTSTIKRGHMFSPYYDDTWYALYDKAQHA